MKRAGFTMIELIFVIVILGILAAVAVPRLTATQNSAKAQVVESFVGTMNRTTLPSMYAAAVRSGGSITSGFTLSEYIEIPTEVGAISIGSCGTGGAWGTVGTATIGAPIYCRDGNTTNPPVFSFSNTEVNATLPTSYYQ